MSSRWKAEYILERSRTRQYFYEIILKMCNFCDCKGIRLIVENPFSTHHYLHANFLYKPTIIDKNRQSRGDYFQKPTQYFFINCNPTTLETYQEAKVKKNVNALSGHVGSLCDEDRSMISPDYARNFICDFILGKAQRGMTQLSLFD